MFLILLSIVLALPAKNSLEICIPNDALIDDLLGSDYGSKLNLTMIDTSLSIIACATIETTNKTEWIGGRLILSDSPEYPSGKGKLYEDANLFPTSINSPNRIFMYHVNGNPDKMLQFVILVTNLNPNESAILTVMQKGVAEPTKNYILSGQRAFYLWLKSEVNSSRQIIQPLETVQLDIGYHQFDVQPDELLHGIYDYHMTQNHKLTLCSLERDDDADVCLDLPLLPRDRHVRGTFPSSDKLVNITHNSSTFMVQQFPVADGVVDEFTTGIDETDGTMQINSGNYGVLYRMNFNILATTQQNFNHSEIGYVVNPRGGIWAGAVGHVGGESYLLPEANSGILRSNLEGALIGKFSTGTNPVILWMPTGGSNLPIRIVGIRYIRYRTEEDNSEPSAAMNYCKIPILLIVFNFLLICCHVSRF